MTMQPQMLEEYVLNKCNDRCYQALKCKTLGGAVVRQTFEEVL